jgi:predicted aspartyl protease
MLQFRRSSTPLAMLLLSFGLVGIACSNHLINQTATQRSGSDPVSGAIASQPTDAQPARVARLVSASGTLTNGQSVTIPITRREGNTPVIRVNFNNGQPFEMIVDTGASGTLITPAMATALGVVPVSETHVDTASERSVSFPMGYVKSMEAGGIEVKNVMVAVAGSELRLGLLGHDFFGNYDVTIRKSEVEFRARD